MKNDPDLSGKNYSNRDVAFLKSAFKAADACLEIDEQIKLSALETLREEIARKQIRLLSDRRKIWQNQLRYTDRSMFFFHLAGGALLLVVLILMSTRGIEPEYMIALAMTLSGVLGFLSILEVGGICFARMAELGDTCFFNIRQMAAFGMVFSSIVNLAVLTAGILFVSFQWKIRLIQIGLYVLVPFLFTQCVCLGVLLTEAGRRNNWLIAAVGISLSAFYAALASTPRLYTESALLVWGGALAAFGVIFGVQVKILFTEIGKGEILCTN